MRKIRLYIRLVYRYYRYNKKMLSTLKFAIVGLINFYSPKENKSEGKRIDDLLNKVKIPKIEKGYIYFIDIYKTLYKEHRVIDNIAIDYKFLLENSLEDLNKKTSKSKNIKENEENTIYALANFIDRINDSTDNKNIEYLLNIKNQKANSFDEALQRILFYNQILWQTNHNLNGLGRLDYILDEYYKNDIKNGKINYEKAYELVKDFCEKLNKYYWYKSNGLVGDTGQVIVLGGMINREEYFSNDLTEIFINVIKEMKSPDPKTILRVSKSTPKKLWEIAFDSIKTGIGNPLISNDDVIVEKMIKFGYSEEDSYNYCTSACWEPSVVGKSFDQNNIDTFRFVDSLLNVLNNEDVNNFKNFGDLFAKTMSYLELDLDKFIKNINNIKFNLDPIVTLSSNSCLENDKDISNGGCYYNNIGFTTVSLSNLVNSLINIKKLCFEQNRYDLKELNNMRINNFKGNEDVINILKKQNKRYGCDDEEVVELTNNILKKFSKFLDKYSTNLGGKFKFGVSSPAYITMCNVPATMDGRKNNEPFNVHISNDYCSNAYTELINFSSNIDYSGNKFNGNVVDLMLNPALIENNEDLFISVLETGVKKGFFQMQINVISSEILIKAKNNPKMYPNLIVRVWGFSAYFNDLPNSYKDLLIERALINEGKSY